MRCFFSRKAQAKQKCLHFYLALPANLRNSQSVFLMIVQKIEKEEEVNHEKDVSSSKCAGCSM